MNTPPASIERPETRQFCDQNFSTRLARGIDRAVQERSEATPEPEFAYEASEDNYQYACEQLHGHFTPDQIHCYRKRINDAEYWEQEAKCYQNALPTHDRMPEGTITSTSEPEWKQLAQSFRETLCDLGFSASKIQCLRWCIPSQTYWQREAELLEPLSRAKEYKLILQWSREARQKQRRSSRRSFQGRPASSCADAPVSSRTRSKTVQSGISGNKLRDAKRISAKSSERRPAYRYAF
ncbi:hypothetical protein BFJ63_vAg15429 [Fusarium oxysporum f. sp. narcissi]|uniref:Uncharacterized protein n=1 Tax=Fusarium oxysporum f. sp. narcissi TaxID=451672 RepID=A0A4Q2VCF6_FUSOX|nr:hypothetical protein BFJ63_vAg15429 [Fusarium oxysporum f. sp. narcissi]